MKIEIDIPLSIIENMNRCKKFMDFPTAWTIQREIGSLLNHDARCSSVPGWNPMSGPAFLCDCGAVEKKYDEIRELLNKGAL